MSGFFFACFFFSKIVDHLRKCATILGRERLCFDFNREKSRKCFLFDKITGKYSVVFAYFSSSFFIIIIFFLSVCFQTGEKKLLLKVHTSILSLSSLKFSSVFLYFSSFFFLIFLLGFCIEQRALPRLVHFRHRNKFRKPNCERGLESFSLRQFQPLGTWSFSFSPLAELLA